MEDVAPRELLSQKLSSQAQQKQLPVRKNGELDGVTFFCGKGFFVDCVSHFYPDIPSRCNIG